MRINVILILLRCRRLMEMTALLSTMVHARMVLCFLFCENERHFSISLHDAD